MPAPLIAVLAFVCFAAGAVTVHSASLRLFSIWRDSDLKSAGSVIPLISFALILRAWRRLGWALDQGSWYGVLLLAVTALVVFVRSKTLLIITLHGWLIELPPLPLIALCYAVALVLLLGGRPLLRAAWFPVLLMLLVIPVPQTFSNAVDLPLQHASAVVARHWAAMLGTPLTQDRLRLMFAPDYGMFIAPGCNGIRGSVTLGLVALVTGYVYRFRRGVWALTVVGAVLTGYLFNFVRLCLLVLYYKFTLPYPALHGHAKMADYIIGGSLFVSAVWLFIWIANRLRRHPEDVREPEPPPALVRGSRHTTGLFLRVAVVLLMAAIFGVDAVQAARQRAAEHMDQAELVTFPAEVGTWHLVRTWNETLLNGLVVYAWGEYAAPVDGSATSGAHVSLGVSPRLGLHDTTVCHMARGDDPLLHEELNASTAAAPASFSATLYNTGSSLRLEAASVCQGASCQQHTEANQHITLLYERPHLSTATSAQRPVPVLLKAETNVTSMPFDQAAATLGGDMQAFLAHADLSAIAAPYAHSVSGQP